MARFIFDKDHPGDETTGGRAYKKGESAKLADFAAGRLAGEGYGRLDDATDPASPRNLAGIDGHPLEEGGDADDTWAKQSGGTLPADEYIQTSAGPYHAKTVAEEHREKMESVKRDYVAEEREAAPERAEAAAAEADAATDAAVERGKITAEEGARRKAAARTADADAKTTAKKSTRNKG